MAYFRVPAHIFTGKAALYEAKECIAACGNKALLVTGKHVSKTKVMKDVMEVLEDTQLSYVIYDGITGEPTDLMIDEGLSMYQENGCDFVIGIGGGSPIDAAKAIAAMSVKEGVISDYIGKMMEGEVPKIVAIPTTAGTGSEATKMTIVTDTKRDIKMLLKGESLVPEIAVVDYSYSMTSPISVTISSGLDALTHAIESFTSKKAIPMTDTLAISAVKRIMKYLLLACNDGTNDKAREEMALAALEAGMCINNSSVTLIHGMSRPIGALFHVPHGLSNAMLLKEGLAFALDGAYNRFAILGREIGCASHEDSDELAAKKLLEAIIKLCEDCKVPTLLEYGIAKEEFLARTEKMARDAILSGSPGNTRKSVSKEDCIQIYERLFVC